MDTLMMPSLPPVLAPPVAPNVVPLRQALLAAANQQAQLSALPVPHLSVPSMGAAAAPALPVPTMPDVVQGNVQSSPTTPRQADLNHLNYLKTSGDGISQIKDPWLRGAARTADVIASVFTPGLDRATPGTSGHHNMLVNQAEKQVQQDQAQAAGDAKISQEQALATQEQAKADALSDPRKAIDPSKTVTVGDGVFQLNPESGKYDIRVGDRVDKPKPIEEQAYEHAVQSGMDPVQAVGAIYGAKNQKADNLPQQYLDAMTRGDTQQASLIRRAINDTQTQPKITVLNAAAADRTPNSGTWTPGFDAQKNPVMFNSKTGEVKPMDGTFSKNTVGAQKIASDEQKRADLAQNMNENINQLEDILNRRPDLFGPLAGRMTQAKVAFGTGDEDAAKLMTIEHQLGMVAQGAHGMRSAQGVESSANSLVNGFKNSPSATKAALEAARSSVGTFLSDSQNPGQARGSITVTAPDGSAYAFPNQAAADKFKQLAGIK